jgi:hypothetical protein
MKLPNADAARIDLQKLRDYSLNANHHRGRHKARVFASTLGLTADDAEELQALIFTAILNDEAVPGDSDEYGQRYTLDFSIRRSGNQATIRTAWIIRPTEDFPRLTSCYVLKERGVK